MAIRLTQHHIYNMLRYYLAASLFIFLTSAKLSSSAFVCYPSSKFPSLYRHGCGSCGIMTSYGNTIILYSNDANDESTSRHPPSTNNNNLSASQRERREEDRRRKLREGTATPGITRYDDLMIKQKTKYYIYNLQHVVNFFMDFSLSDQYVLGTLCFFPGAPALYMVHKILQSM